jgi:hypothetical protein
MAIVTCSRCRARVRDEDQREYAKDGSGRIVHCCHCPPVKGWDLTAQDRRFLRSLRIAPEQEPSNP